MDANNPITVVVTRRVKPGKEAQFETALHDYISNSLQLAGQLGVQVMRPPEGSRDYCIIRRFRDRAALEEYRFSPEYLKWNDDVLDLTEAGGQAREMSGLETWFTLPTGTRLHKIPRWKMASATLMGVYPLSLLFGVALLPALKGFPFWAKNLVTSIGFVVLLNWLVMPVINRLLRRWLYPVDVETSTGLKLR